MTGAGCTLCHGAGGAVVYQAAAFRVIRAAEPGFPAFYRLVWNDHVAEFSDLPAPARALCMEALVQIELALRQVLSPAKINLAALGNMVPHLHWHLIARFCGDTHFPAPVWAAPMRPADPLQMAGVEARLPALEREIVARLRLLVPPVA